MSSVTGLVFDDVYMCQPAGSLSSLQWFPNLKVLRVNRGNQLMGKIEDLRHAPQLEELRFRGAPAVGHIEDLGALKNLKSLMLSFVAVQGNLAALQRLPLLKYLRLSDLEVGPVISGDLLDLRPLVQLEHIELSKIGGDLHGLSNLTRLKHVAIKAKVRGVLSDLADLRQLEHLDLAHGQVLGSLDDLAGLTQLRHFNLGNFNPLHGNMTLLARMTRLKEFDARTTKLQGCYSDFKKLEFLQEFVGDHLDLAPGCES